MGMVTTATAKDLERIDRTVLNWHEDPRKPNITFVWADLIKWKLAPAWFQGQPYCAGGIVWTDKKAGAPLLPVQSPFYVPSRVQYARAHGLWSTSGRYQPGDELVLAFSVAAQRAGLGEHVERVLSDDGKVVTTIGFNTSSGTTGSQSNGEGIYLRKRPHGPMVLGAISYSKLLAHGVAPQNKVRVNPYGAALRGIALGNLPIHKGAKGDAVRAIQWAVGVPVDGVFGDNTLNGVLLFQRYHVDQNGRKLIPDGEVGRLTRWAVLKITHFQH